METETLEKREEKNRTREEERGAKWGRKTEKRKRRVVEAEHEEVGGSG
jgi:hypothetical protein